MVWFEDENFWKQCYPYLFQQERFEVAVEQVQQVLALTEFSGETMLDLCCGPGRHVVALARHGLKVTGVDRSLFLLSLARQRATEARVNVEFVHEDMRCFVRPEAFDCVINIYSSFGYFENQNDDIRVLRNIFQSLKAGGACLIDTVGKEWLSAYIEPELSYEEPDGSRFIQRHTIDEDWKRQSTDWTLIKGGEIQTFKFSIRIYTGAELQQLMLSVGFSEVRLYGDFTGKSFGQRGDRIIAVGYKNGAAG